MQRSVLRGMLALAAVAALGYNTGVSAATCTTTLVAGVDDIQVAIDAATAGDVICLGAGTYSPAAKIHIDKTVTLQGPQAGVDPRPSAGSTRAPGDTSTEAIIDGNASSLSGIIVIKADNVVLDGLQVTDGSGDMIDSEPGIPISGIIVRNNIVNHATGDEGMQIRACTGCSIEYNYVFDIAQDGINMCCGSTGGTIQFNEVADNSSENAAIYLYETTNMTIQCNTVYDVYNNEGIKLGAKNGTDAANWGGSILNNSISDTAQDGIAVYMSDTLVEGNDVSYSTSENGAIYVAQAVSDVTIRRNDVHDNTLNIGKWGDPGAIMIGTGVDAATTTVNNNNVTGNSVNGVTNKAASLLDATNNWWGAADGPSGAGTGSGDAVSTNVTFAPFLAAPQDIPDACTPVPTYSCQGFEPPMNLAFLPPAMGGGPIGRKVKRNRVLPFKALLVDSEGNIVTDLVSPPVIQVIFDAVMAPMAVDVTVDALTNGKGTDGNEFELSGDKWHFNLKTKNYSAEGTYTSTMQSGDTDEYLIDPTCEGIFVIE